MEKFACKDIGMMDCSFVATGTTVAEVKDKAMAHARTVHAAMLKGMTPAQLTEMTMKVEKAIKHTA